MVCERLVTYLPSEYFLTLAVGAALAVYSFSICHYIHSTRGELRSLERLINSIKDDLHPQLILSSKWVRETKESMSSRILSLRKVQDVLKSLLSTADDVFWELNFILKA